MATEKLWKLSPSDFSFLWQCKRCFYLKVVENVKQVSIPMPKIFNKIASLEKKYFDSKDASDIAPDLPAGKVLYGEKRVKSQVISFPDIEGSCYISGRFDNVVEFTDGSYGMIDFKTAEANVDHIPLYSRQLHAYTYAVEHPAEGSLFLSPVSKLGLCCSEPTSMFSEQSSYGFMCESRWMECDRDDNAFMEFIREVLIVLAGPDPPPASFNCQWCHYRDYSRNSGL